MKLEGHANTVELATLLVHAIISVHNRKRGAHACSGILQGRPYCLSFSGSWLNQDERMEKNGT